MRLIQDRLLQKIMEIDEDGNMEITRAELSTLMESPESISLIDELNINFLFFTQICHVLFPTTDSTISYQELLEVLLACRGDTAATVAALGGGFCYMSSEVHKVQATLMRIMEKVDHLNVTLHYSDI